MYIDTKICQRKLTNGHIADIVHECLNTYTHIEIHTDIHRCIHTGTGTHTTQRHTERKRKTETYKNIHRNIHILRHTEKDLHKETHTERDIDIYREKEINIRYIHRHGNKVLLFKTQTQLPEPK